MLSLRAAGSEGLGVLGGSSWPRERLRCRSAELHCAGHSHKQDEPAKAPAKAPAASAYLEVSAPAHVSPCHHWQQDSVVAVKYQQGHLPSSSSCVKPPRITPKPGLPAEPRSSLPVRSLSHGCCSRHKPAPRGHRPVQLLDTTGSGHLHKQGNLAKAGLPTKSSPACAPLFRAQARNSGAS